MDTGEHWESVEGYEGALGGIGWQWELLGRVGGSLPPPAPLTLCPPPPVTKTNLSVHEDKNRVPYVKVRNLSEDALGGGPQGAPPEWGLGPHPPPRPAPPGLHRALRFQPRGDSGCDR